MAHEIKEQHGESELEFNTIQRTKATNTYQQASISRYECKKKRQEEEEEEETHTRIGHGDVMAFVRIEPYFALSALHH